MPGGAGRQLGEQDRIRRRVQEHSRHAFPSRLPPAEQRDEPAEVSTARAKRLGHAQLDGVAHRICPQEVPAASRNAPQSGVSVQDMA
jgi:hypothetical protein